MIFDETENRLIDLTFEDSQTTSLEENCESTESTEALNNGGTTDYYQIDPKWKQAQDIIEARDMNFSQGNILKSAFCFNTKRHSGTSYERELNKIIWFCKRELERLSKDTQKTSKEENCNSKEVVCVPLEESFVFTERHD